MVQIYLHGSDARQQAIADTLSQLARDELQQGTGAKRGRSARKPGLWIKRCFRPDHAEPGGLAGEVP